MSHLASILKRRGEDAFEINLRRKGKMKLSMSIGSILVAVAMVSIVSAQTGDKGAEKTVVGYISDSMCGMDHSAMKMGDDKTCTLKCVDADAKFVLADRAHKVVYTLDGAGQEKAREFAGQKVNVTGQVDAKAKTIRVTKIESAK
jgi:hypothetical protein